MHGIENRYRARLPDLLRALKSNPAYSYKGKALMGNNNFNVDMVR
ncbi:MAG: hypothetical protein ACXV7G_04310 [Halobacteriota archaeon]